MKKILILRLSSLGDIILTLNSLEIIRREFPDCIIHYVTKNQYAPLLKNHPCLDKLFTTDDSINFEELRNLKKKIRTEKYDAVIDLHNNIRTFYLRMFSRNKWFVFKKHSIKKWLFVNFKMNYLKELPSVQKRYINTFTGLISSSAITNEQINLNYLTEDITLKSPAQWLSEIKKNRKKIITILAGTKHFTKTYPPEMFAEVIRLIRTEEYQIILTGNDADRKNAGIIKEHCGNEVLDLCGKLSLTELFLILQLSTFVIGGDTGPMHIAEALNIPLIMLAGSSVREFGFYPQSDNAVILENENLKCRPCSHIGKSICKERHFRCMRDIKPEMIYKEFLISQQKHR